MRDRLSRGTKACSNALSPKPEYLARTAASSGVALRPSLPNCLSTRRASMLAFHRCTGVWGYSLGGRVCHRLRPLAHIGVEQMHPPRPTITPVRRRCPGRSVPQPADDTHPPVSQGVGQSPRTVLAGGIPRSDRNAGSSASCLSVAPRSSSGLPTPVAWWPSLQPMLTSPQCKLRTHLHHATENLQPQMSAGRQAGASLGSFSFRTSPI